MKLQDFVVKSAIVPQLKSVERDDAIIELIDALIESGAAPKSIREDLIKYVLDREKKGSTGFGKGVAVPHVKHEKIKKIAATIGISQQGVDFNSLDKAPVYSIVLILSPWDRPNEHLEAMENVFSNLMIDNFRKFLRQATTVEEVSELMVEADAKQLN